MVEPGKTRPPPPKPPPMPKGPPPRTTTTTPKPSPARPASGPNDASEATVKRPRKRAGKLRWLLGWVIVPLVLLGALFLAGVHVGARHPQMWLSRATLWMFDREPQLGLTDEERQPLARTLRLLILPTKEHSFEVDVTEAELEEIARAANLTPKTLDCETVCRSLWLAKHPDLEFISALHCKLTEPAEVTPPAKPGPAKLECNAKVQRAGNSS
jgi:hypothetical protein